MADEVASLRMSRPAVFLLLLVCALLEAGGDALARKGMYSGTIAGRAGFYSLAALMLFGYGWLVNRPPWSFGSLLGVYMALFFVVAQVIGFFVFGEKFTVPLIAGGVLIAAGGLVIALWR